jgi:1-aminocyclopropane-1-carboxylate deaminase/D-cysteine desulfhydrase-like pyridoxal-dependent ACC family enzyme
MTTPGSLKPESHGSATSEKQTCRLPLFARFPELEETLPRFPLGDFPTPVERLSHLGHDNLWIKRDDLTSSVYGGNKVRKLEFTLADALGRGCRQVITMGGIGTNHGLATAIFSREAGLACKLLLFPQPVNDYVKQNMLLFCRYGAELKYHKGPLRAGAALMVTQRLLNPGAYILEAGGSSPVGTVGLVNAMFELAGQIRAGLMPEPRYIFCALGTSGTMAGLSLGARLAGLSTTVVGVRVTMASVGPVDIATPETVENLMQKTLKLLKKRCRAIPNVAIGPQHVVDDYVGEGYGCATRKCRAALDLVRDKENITLDPTYTAKAFAALLDYIEKPPYRSAPVLYWHTYSSAELSACPGPADFRMLPPKLRRVYKGRE